MKNLFSLLFLFIAAPLIAAPKNKEIEKLLLKLDSLIGKKEIIEKEKELRISQLRLQKATVSSLEEEYWLNKKFYDEYYAYDADSTAYYISRNLKIAADKDWKERVLEWKIKKSHLLTATGLLKEAVDELQGISGNDLPTVLKIEYYGEMIYLYSHFGQYIGDDAKSQREYYNKEMLYRDSICMLITPEHPLYLWYKGGRSRGADKVPEIQKELIDAVSKSGLDTYRDALNAYILAHLYLDEGDKTSYLKYIIYSAMADIRTANKDIASLEELIQDLFTIGDIDRAYTYGNYCLQMGQAYHNRIRVADILSILDEIHKVYQKRNQEQQGRLSHYLIMMSILSVILLVAVLYIYRQMRRLSESRQKLNDANNSLNKHIVQLSETHHKMEEMNKQLQLLNKEQAVMNDQLRESNYIAEEYIAYAFSLCSTYISKLDEFRKTINRKIKTGQSEEVKQITEASVVKKELKEFYHSFDSVFLRIYPDFVHDFNNLLRPEEQIVMKEGELLNTDLRIYALVRLGINDSVKIAKFLHCSPQTVYNNRLKMRSRACVPKDEFVERVKSLGKVQDKPA